MTDLDALLERLNDPIADMQSSHEWALVNMALKQEAAAAIRELQGANLLMRAKAETYDLALADKHAWEDTANYHKAEADALRADVEALRALLRVAKCPNCDGAGSIAVPVGDRQWEQEQCQWCDERAAIDDARKP